MNEEAAFLAGIRANPGDAALRLVYADWLEERGDPRAEFIRIWEEMATLPAYTDRYVELKARRNELAPKIDEGWRTQLGYVPTYRPLFTSLPQHRAERWRLVEEFIGVWYRPLAAGDGASEEELWATEKRLGFRLPTALREWHALAGKRKDVWSKQDHLWELDYLKLEDSLSTRRDALIFYVENQACEIWGIRKKDLGLDDPPVYRFLEPAHISPTTSAFVIQVLLYEAKWRGPVIASGEFNADDAAFREVRRKFRRSQVSQRYWCTDPTRVYEGKDILIETHVNQWIYVSARTEAAYQQLSEGLRERLERHD